jgi:Zn-dependent M28 family amino/carboxypeptidase
LGVRDTKIFNGADDNASGAAALLTMANYFKNKTRCELFEKDVLS